MANTCYNTIQFYSPVVTRMSGDFYADLVNLTHSDPNAKYVCCDDGSEGYYNVSIPFETIKTFFEEKNVDFTETLEKYPKCLRGTLTCLNYDLSITTETDNVPKNEIWDTIISQLYTDSNADISLKYVFRAEECAMDLYINTDTDGRFFDDLYKLEYQFGEDEYEVEYFSGAEDAIDFLKDLAEKQNIDISFIPDNTAYLDNLIICFENYVNSHNNELDDGHEEEEFIFDFNYFVNEI